MRMYGISEKETIIFLSTLISILLPPEKLQMQLSRQRQSNLRFSSRRYTYARRNYPFLHYIILIYNPLTTMLPIIASLSIRGDRSERERERKRRVAMDLEKNRCRGGFTLRRRMYVANSPMISGYRDEREIRWCRNKCKDHRKT